MTVILVFALCASTNAPWNGEPSTPWTVPEIVAPKHAAPNNRINPNSARLLICGRMVRSIFVHRPGSIRIHGGGLVRRTLDCTNRVTIAQLGAILAFFHSLFTKIPNRFQLVLAIK